MSHVIRQEINWTEEGLVPDTIVRSAIRRLRRARLVSLRTADVDPGFDAGREWFICHYQFERRPEVDSA